MWAGTAYFQFGYIPELPLEALAVTKFSLLSQGWQLKLFGSVAIVGTLFIAVGESVLAQIAPDNTLGAEGSVVTPNVNIQGIQGDRIDGGATRGANLFHSFWEFNVGEGRGAYFANPTGIENILTRVTGGNPFNILGRLGVLGGADLFLLNPNGIVFGQNASLDVQGSFVATTANAIQFSNGEVFSASTPSAPSSLLTVNPSAFFFNQVPAGAIANYSRTPVGATPLGNQFGLRVPDGRSLLLVGGDIVMDGGGAIARDGQIELGAIAGSGTVGLNVDGNDLSLSFPDGADRADISLGNGALVSVNGEGGGDIQVEGRRITLSGGSQITATTLGAETGRTLAVTASDSVELIGESADGQRLSGLFAQSVGSGDAGELTIDTGRLLVRDGARVGADTFAEGKGGRLQITASESVELIGESADGQRLSGLSAQSNRGSSGDAGDLTIVTGRLLVRDGAQVGATTFGEGNGGSLQITASESVELIGITTNGQFGSRLVTLSTASGDAGDLTINTPRLLVQDGAQVDSSNRGSGNGGRLQITASDSVEVIGRAANGQFDSGLFTYSRGSGDAGDLTIETPRLLVSDGAWISAGTLGEGNGGRLQITASHLLVQNGARVSAITTGSGNSGSLQITVSESVELIGITGGSRATGLFTSSQGSGDAGNLTIDTRRLLVRDGAQVGAGTLGEGNGSRLQITVSESVELIGITGGSRVATGLFTQSQGTGNAGDLTIDTRRLLVRDGAQVGAGTLGEGNSSRLQITASDSIEVIGGGSNLLTQSRGTGNAGDLTIDTPRLLVRDGAAVSASTLGTGKGGKLTLETAQLSLSQGGRILVSTFGTGDAGQLNVNATQIELIGTNPINGSPSGLFATVSSNATGNGGDVTIDTHRLLLRDGAFISSATRGDGTAGNINITVRDTLEANNGTIATSTTKSAGGVITITAGDIRLFGDSDIISNVASGADNGGNINLTADSILAFDDSDILAFARDGRGGDITLNTRVFFGENYRPAPKGTDPNTLENNNQVDVNASGAVNGVITTPDVSFIQNSLTELPENQIDTDSLLASSCIVRRNQPTRGSFTITGTGGFPQRPGDAQMSTFPTVDIETLPNDSTPTNTNPNRPWQKGDPIVEPQGVYRLPNGKPVLSRECS
jgi:filamentous hemagglutinin family protein